MGTFASSFSFGKTARSVVGEPLSVPTCRDSLLCVARAVAWAVDLPLATSDG